MIIIDIDVATCHRKLHMISGPGSSVLWFLFLSHAILTFPKSGRYVVGMLCLTAVSFEVDLNPEAV